VNRVDEFIVFEPLIRSQIRDIVGLRASALVDRVATQHITMKLGDSALEFLAAKVSAGSQGSQRSVLGPRGGAGPGVSRFWFGGGPWFWVGFAFPLCGHTAHR
jgi:Cdc6-like AAA superfamily ATPase